MSAPLLEVSNVTKVFSIPRTRRDTVREHVLDFFRPHPHDRLEVLKGVSFQLREGETLGIMGANGCGKSTLLKIVAGIYPPNSGSVTVRGAVTPILELGVGWNPDLDAVDNIYLLGSVMGLTLKELKGAIDEILDFAGLERFASLQLRHYSSGMAERLAYSVAFRAVKELLILDEIFAVGDLGFRMRCEARYRELKASGHTIILVSHAVPIINDFCDRAVLIETGRIVMDGPAPEVAKMYISTVTSGPTAVGRLSR
jgi:ABC-type polysaccharide/polyol phosphate transport system ATPase subunit